MFAATICNAAAACCNGSPATKSIAVAACCSGSMDRLGTACTEADVVFWICAAIIAMILTASFIIPMICMNPCWCSRMISWEFVEPSNCCNCCCCSLGTLMECSTGSLLWFTVLENEGRPLGEPSVSHKPSRSWFIIFCYCLLSLLSRLRSRTPSGCDCVAAAIVRVLLVSNTTKLPQYGQGNVDVSDEDYCFPFASMQH